MIPLGGQHLSVAARRCAVSSLVVYSAGRAVLLYHSETRASDSFRHTTTMPVLLSADVRKHPCLLYAHWSRLAVSRTQLSDVGIVHVLAFSA